MIIKMMNMLKVTDGIDWIINMNCTLSIYLYRRSDMIWMKNEIEEKRKNTKKRKNEMKGENKSMLYDSDVMWCAGTRRDLNCNSRSEGYCIRYKVWDLDMILYDMLGMGEEYSESCE